MSLSFLSLERKLDQKKTTKASPSTMLDYIGGLASSTITLPTSHRFLVSLSVTSVPPPPYLFQLLPPPFTNKQEKRTSLLEARQKK